MSKKGTFNHANSSGIDQKSKTLKLAIKHVNANTLLQERKRFFKGFDAKVLASITYYETLVKNHPNDLMYKRKLEDLEGLKFAPKRGNKGSNKAPNCYRDKRESTPQNANGNRL